MPTFQYDIAVIGEATVDRALAGIERRIGEHNRRVTAMANQTAGTNVRTSEAARRSGGGGGLSPVEREAREAARAASSLDRQRSAALFREYAARNQLERRAGEEAERGSRSLERQRSQALYQEFQLRERLQAQSAATARREFRQRTGRVVDAGLGSIGGIGAAALTTVGLGAGALIASKIGPAMSLDKAQRALVTAGHGAGETSPLNLEQVQSLTSATSIETGQSQQDVVAGMREYVGATGDLAGAAKAIKSFATIATAAEGNVLDVSKAAAYLSKNMGITAKEMPEVLSNLYFQGKKGAFEMKDLSSAVPILGAQAASLGMSGVEGVRTLGGLAQIAQTGTGNPAEAQTALSNLFTQIVAKSDKLASGAAFGGHSVKVYENNDPSKKMMGIREILANMIVASHGNVQELEKFGEIRGSRALNPMVNVYKDAVAGLGPKATQKEKDKVGGDAVLKMIEDNADAPGTFKDVQADAADSLKTLTAQLEILNTGLTNAVQKDLLPVLIELMPQLKELVPEFAQLVRLVAKAVDVFAKDPIANIGEIIATKVALDIAQAAIGSRIREALVNSLTGGTTTGGGTGATGGKGGKGGSFLGAGETMGSKILGNALAAVTILTLSVETFRAGQLVIDSLLTTNKKDVESDLKRFNLERGAVTGSGDSGDVKTRLHTLQELQGEAQHELQGPFMSKDPVLRAAQASGAKPLAGYGDATGDALAAEKAKTDAELKATIDRLSKEISTLAASLPKDAPNRGNAPSPVKS